MKDKKGKTIGFKEFMHRWKDGMQNTTPLQQISVIQKGYWILIIGIVLGIVYAVQKGMVWLALVLVGALIINLMGILGNGQKMRMLRSIATQQSAFSNPNTYIQ